MERTKLRPSLSPAKGSSWRCRRLPAGEGFEAAKKGGAKLYERLKIRNDLVTFECSAQIICVISRHGRDDTTATRTYPVNFRAFQRETRSLAASGQWGKVK